MTTKVVALFNNKGGVGKTSLVYHLSWMYADLGLRLIAADLDPQANLTAAFLEEDRLEQFWPEGDHPDTISGFVQPLLRGTGDIVSPPHVERVDGAIGLIVGDLALSSFEDDLSSQWPDCLDGKERAFRVISALWRIIQNAAKAHAADMVLVDLGPNLGAINRVALISADYVVVPLSPDLFSLQGLRNLGPTLRKWRTEWRQRVQKNPVASLPIPKGNIEPIGYVVQQHSVRFDRPVQAYDRWIARIPGVYRTAVLNEISDNPPVVQKDPNCLALLKHYRSLMPMAQEAHKPIFHLKPADGAIGAQLQAVQGANQDFRVLATKIADRVGISAKLLQKK